MRVEVHMPEADQTTLAKTSVQTNLKIFYIFYIKVKVRDEQKFCELGKLYSNSNKSSGGHLPRVPYFKI